MHISLKNLIVPSIPMAVLLVLTCCGLWLSSFFGGRLITLADQPSSLVQTLQTFLHPNTLQSNLVGLGFTLINALLLAQINNRFTIIRTRTFLPIFIFLLLMSVWNGTHISNGSHITLTLFIFALFSFFNMSRNKNSSGEAFMGCFFISVSSLLINALIFIIPICLIGFIMFQSFSLRTFLAAIFGTLIPWILYLSGRYLFDPYFDFTQAFVFALNLDFNFAIFSIPDLIYAALLVVMMIISLVGLRSLSHSDAIHTRNKLNFLIFLLVSFSVLTVLFKNQYVSFLPIIALIYSLLMSHPLTLKQNSFYCIFFLIFCFINIAFIVSKYII